uniref:Putative secreted protein n=1 Tax=Amblyomma americanum TaxID=6943 RepID=A0A0C9SD39_AMBAM
MAMKAGFWISLLIPIAVAFTGLLLVFPEVKSEGVSRMATNVKYSAYQDIFKAFSFSKFLWLSGSNYNISELKEKSCISIQISNISKDGMDYSSVFKEGSERKKLHRSSD